MGGIMGSNYVTNITDIAALADPAGDNWEYVEGKGISFVNPDATGDGSRRLSFGKKEERKTYTVRKIQSNGGQEMYGRMLKDGSDGEESNCDDMGNCADANNQEPTELLLFHLDSAPTAAVKTIVIGEPGVAMSYAQEGTKSKSVSYDGGDGGQDKSLDAYSDK
jgi:hypothetical protein